MSDRTLFIINPHSGTSKQALNEDSISSLMLHDNWSLIHTEHPGHAREIALNNLEKCDLMVAVGGDGTINEVASVLTGTTVSLGIVPRGSGNGLANSLGIPSNLEEAFNIFKTGNARKIDTMTINEHFFVNMAGVGFDGYIARLFDDFGSRGLLSYARLVIGEYLTYPGIEVTISFDGKELKDKVLVASFANSSQYGNNAHIAPNACLDDGKADIGILRKFPLLISPKVAYQLFNKTINHSTYYSGHRAEEVLITSDKEMDGHVDGEPVMLGNEARIRVKPQSLFVIAPS